MKPLPCVCRPPCEEGVLLQGTCSCSCSARTQARTLFAAILGSSLSFIDVSAVNLALPAIQAEFTSTAAEAQWILESSGVVVAALLLLGGTLGDRLGRRKVFASGTILFVLSSAACALSRGTMGLVAARVFLGIGSALMIPGSLSLIGSVFPEEKRAFAAGLWSAATALSIVAAQLVGGWMLDTLSWRVIFLVPLPVGALVLALLPGVPETRSETRTGSLDWEGAVLGVLSLGSLTWGLLEAQARGIGPMTAGAVLLGACLFYAFLRHERKHPFPLVPLEIFRSRTFSGICLLTFLLYGGFTGSLFFLPFNLIQVQGYSALQAGAANLPFILVMAGLAPVSGALSGRVGPKRSLVAGSLVTGIAFLLFALPGVGGSYWATFFFPACVLGAGFALTVPALSSLVIGSAPAGGISLASALNSAISRVAGVTAIAAMGSLLLFSFSAELDRRTAGLSLPEAAREQARTSRAGLASMKPPDGLAPGEAASFRDAVKWSFVGGFRRLLAVAAVMAAMAALSAALFVEEVPGRAIPDQEGGGRSP
jgi:EmrB/QacA subfamily drug resistance transporter